MDPLIGARSPGRRSELEALLVLDGLPGVGPAAVRGLLATAGSAGRALRRPALLDQVAGAGTATLAADPARRAAARRALDLADRLDMRTLLLGDGAYPPRLLHLTDPPPLLFLRGRAELLDTPGVAVVGARRATERARAVACRLGAAVAGAGTPVVSGLALGVDGAAHRGALDAHGPTIAVLGRGADRAYPTCHAALYRDVVQRGLAVSEFPPGTPPLPHHFPRRNRILAALCHTVVVVEAGARSGALITVEHALDLGVEVWAVPGPIEEAATAGTNDLLADGARPLVSVAGFVRAVLGAEPGTPAAVAASPEEATVLDCLAGGARSADEVSRATGLAAGRALAVLSGLELQGLVARSAGMRFRRAG